MGVSSRLLLDATGTPGSELDSIYSLSDRSKFKKEQTCRCCGPLDLTKKGACRIGNDNVI